MPTLTDTDSSGPPTPSEAGSGETYDVLEDISEDFSSAGEDTGSVSTTIEESDQGDDDDEGLVSPKHDHLDYIPRCLGMLLNLAIFLIGTAAFFAFGVPIGFAALYMLFYSGVYFINKFFPFAFTLVYFGIDLIDKYFPFVAKSMAYIKNLNARPSSTSPPLATSSPSQEPPKGEFTLILKTVPDGSFRLEGFDSSDFAFRFLQCLCASIIASLLVAAFKFAFLSMKQTSARQSPQRPNGRRRGWP